VERDPSCAIHPLIGRSGGLLLHYAPTGRDLNAGQRALQIVDRAVGAGTL
jgi:hypothetical protein